MNPLIAFSLVWIPVVTVLSLAGVRYMWSLVRRERESYRLVDPRRVTLTVILAWAATAAFTAGVILAAPLIAFVVNAPIEVRRVTGNLIVVAIDLLLPLPLAIAFYLRWRS